jgi:hypothetical protein
MKTMGRWWIGNRPGPNGFQYGRITLTPGQIISGGVRTTQEIDQDRGFDQNGVIGHRRRAPCECGVAL